MAYDAARQRVVLFGGVDGTSRFGVLGDTWEWDGVSWVARSSAVSPPARGSHAMAYDAARHRVVLFGGYGGGINPVGFGDTWEWDGVNWAQQNPGVSPPVRGGHAMTYDAARQRVVLFGGHDATNSVLLGDLWEWDGVSWVQQNPAAMPTARRDHALVYDAARQRVVLFGGFANGLGWVADTWEWDGVSWVQRNPAVRPPIRYSHAMAYDLARQRVVLFGGLAFASFGDTWEWDGVSWIQRNPAVSPPARSGHAMAYDSTRQRVVLFGGAGAFSNSSQLGDTWEWDGLTWVPGSPAASPVARDSHAMAHDAARQRVVLFGGHFLLGDTWEWDGVSWVLRNPAASPTPRSAHAMAYDAARQRVVLFGGHDGNRNVAETWEWDGVSWIQRNPAVSPPARSYHALAYDTARQRIVLFGGGGSSTLGDTWEWDGVSWTQRNPATSPPGRAYVVMAYDTARQRLVLFGGLVGGGTRLKDTWEWDGAIWTQLSPAASPTARYGHAMTYDAARQRVVLFGGDDGTVLGGVADTWEWDGVTWALRNPAASPGARYGHAMAYDAARERVVLSGGSFSSSDTFGDTWLHGNLVPAGMQTIGSACTGTNGPPVIASNLPFLGNQAFVLDLLLARASAPCLFMLSTGTQALNLGGGCTLYLNGVFVPIFTASNMSGFASVKFSIPLDPSLRGGAAYAQAFVFDPMGSFAGLALSAGLKLVFGD